MYRKVITWNQIVPRDISDLIENDLKAGLRLFSDTLVKLAYSLLSASAKFVAQ